MPPETNVLLYGDNLGWLRDRARFPDECADLVYLDPPFNSRRDYNVVFGAGAGAAPADAGVLAFEDSWSWDGAAQEAYEELLSDARVAGLMRALHEALGPGDVLAYLAMMTPRLVELRRVLRPSGSIYLHCDPAASHYLKVVMDAVFGARNFRREVIWRSGWVSGFKAAARNWARNHDVLLYYAKDWSRDTYFDKPRAYAPHRRGYARRGGGGNPRGVALDDVWDEVELYSPWIKSFSREKLGYRTQKPLALLRRIVSVSCPPGGLVLDPFCGCGTTLAAAEELGRRWVGIDVTHLAVALTRARLRERPVEVVGEPRGVDEARALAARAPEQFRWWAISLLGLLPRDRERSGGVDGELGGAVARVADGAVSAADVRALAGAEDGVVVALDRPPRRVAARVVTVAELIAGPAAQRAA